jgi:hypothetical protein
MVLRVKRTPVIVAAGILCVQALASHSLTIAVPSATGYGTANLGPGTPQ